MHKYSPEYGKVPEQPEVREFVYWNLIDFFGIDEESVERPGGKRRGSIHSASVDQIVNFLDTRAEMHNTNRHSGGAAIVLGRATVLKVMNELSVLDIASAAYTYSKFDYFEAKLFTAEDGYSEENAKEAFKFSPRSNTTRG